MWRKNALIFWQRDRRCSHPWTEDEKAFSFPEHHCHVLHWYHSRNVSLTQPDGKSLGNTKCQTESIPHQEMLKNSRLTIGEQKNAIENFYNLLLTTFRLMMLSTALGSPSITVLLVRRAMKAMPRWVPWLEIKTNGIFVQYYNSTRELIPCHSYPRKNPQWTKKLIARGRHM